MEKKDYYKLFKGLKRVSEDMGYIGTLEHSSKNNLIKKYNLFLKTGLDDGVFEDKEIFTTLNEDDELSSLFISSSLICSYLKN